MKPWQVILLLAYCTGLSLGQILFKKAAISLHAEARSKVLLVAVASNGTLWSAVLLYAGLTGLWVYILSVTDLSKAYPFHALTLALTPLLASRLFDERLSPSFYIGLAAILLGLCLIAWDGPKA